LALLEVVSKALLLKLREPDQTHRNRFGEVEIWDSAADLADDEGLIEYRIHLGIRVATREEVISRRYEVWRIAKELDRLWTYVTGSAINAISWKLAPVGPPEGWTSNHQEVSQKLPGQGEPELIVGRRREWTVGPHYPLRTAVEALHAYRAATEPVRTLVELDYNAQRVWHGSGNFLFLAKGLELARAMSGLTHQQFVADCDSELDGYLRRSAAWLFGIANTRLETRHVVQSPADLELHPRMSDDERRDYKHDASLVLRLVVSEALDIPVVVSGKSV